MFRAYCTISDKEEIEINEFSTSTELQFKNAGTTRVNKNMGTNILNSSNITARLGKEARLIRTFVKLI